jgi:DNA-binding transcriptional LysR family regulator
MMLELRHLRAFTAVAEELSFSRAAARLHIAQPALSRIVRDAEAILGFPLFKRSTRVVRLTAAGSAFLIEASDILGRMEIAVRTAHRTAHGELGALYIGYNDFAIPGLLPNILKGFRTSYPEVNVSLKMLTSPQMAEMIRQRSLDIGFLTGTHLVADLSSQLLVNERLVCLLPKDHRLAHMQVMDLCSLADEPFVMGASPGWDIFLEIVRQFCREAGFEPRIVQEADYGSGIVELVGAGLGVSIYVERPWLQSRDDIVVRHFTRNQPAIATIAAWHPDLCSEVASNFVRRIELAAGSSAGQSFS